MSRLYKNIGSSDLHKVASLFAEDPYQYRNGWPDLTLITPQSKLVFAEVKVNDKFHYNQIKLLLQVLVFLPHPFVVIKAKQSEKTVLPDTEDFFMQ